MIAHYRDCSNNAQSQVFSPGTLSVDQMEEIYFHLSMRNRIKTIKLSQIEAKKIGRERFKSTRYKSAHVYDNPIHLGNKEAV